MMEAEGARSRVTLGAVPERRALNFHTPGPSARPEQAPLLQRGHAPHEGWDEELYKSSSKITVEPPQEGKAERRVCIAPDLRHKLRRDTDKADAQVENAIELIETHVKVSVQRDTACLWEK